MNKERKCKGTHKDTYGLGCGEMVNAANRKLGLGRECLCYSKFLVNTSAGRKRIEQATLKATEPRRELEKASKARKKENSLSNLIQSVVQVCHSYIRRRDMFKPCISCNAYWNGDFQAGHFYKAELYPNIKLHPKNINGQCRVCNLHKDGNFEGYRNGILKRYGKRTLDQLDQKASDYKINGFQWDREKLIEERFIYREMLKELEAVH